METYTVISKCEFCNKDVSPIVFKLQNRHTASKFKKHGKCCVSCSADEAIDFSQTKDTHYSERIKLNTATEPESKSDDQVIFTKSDSDDIPANGIKEKIADSRKLIFSGRVIGVVGGLSAFILFYAEFLFMALGGLIVLILGIIVCRIGVWKKGKCRKNNLHHT